MEEVVIEASRSSPSYATAFIWITALASLGVMIIWRMRTQR
jgi:hypothetical protein